MKRALTTKLLIYQKQFGEYYKGTFEIGRSSINYSVIFPIPLYDLTGAECLDTANDLRQIANISIWNDLMDVHTIDDLDYPHFFHFIVVPIMKFFSLIYHSPLRRLAQGQSVFGQSLEMSNPGQENIVLFPRDFCVSLRKKFDYRL